MTCYDVDVLYILCSNRSVDRLFGRCCHADNVPTWNYFLLRAQVCLS